MWSWISWNVKGEYSSVACAKNHEVIKSNYEKPNKDLRSQPIQQPKKENLQRKRFAPKCRSSNQFSHLHNNVECFIYHNFGHFATNCRRIFTEILSAPTV